MGQGRHSLSDIEAMLHACAPDTVLELRLHHYWARRGALVYRKLPKGSGPRGESKQRIEVENGHIRSLVRSLAIDPNGAKRHLQGVWD